MAAEFISPLQIVFARILLGFIPVFVYALSSRALRIVHFRFVHHFFVMSLLAASVYYYGFVMGSYLLPSAIAGALSGAIPLFAFILTVFFLKEEVINSLKISGVVIGFIGVIVIANPFSTSLDEKTLEGTLYLLAGALSVGASFVYAKKFIAPLRIPAAALTTYQLGLASVLLLFITDFDGISDIAQAPHALVGLVLGLGLFGTGLAYIGYYYIIDTMGAIAASSVTYLPPVVALLIGVLIMDEKITMLDYLGASLIVAGIFLLNKRKAKNL
jgi:drug/metabolite transporter (DMT)-like permease